MSIVVLLLAQYVKECSLEDEEEQSKVTQLFYVNFTFDSKSLVDTWLYINPVFSSFISSVGTEDKLLNTTEKNRYSKLFGKMLLVITSVELPFPAFYKWTTSEEELSYIVPVPFVVLPTNVEILKVLWKKRCCEMADDIWNDVGHKGNNLCSKLQLSAFNLSEPTSTDIVCHRTRIMSLTEF